MPFPPDEEFEDPTRDEDPLDRFLNKITPLISGAMGQAVRPPLVSLTLIAVKDFHPMGGFNSESEWKNVPRRGKVLPIAELLDLEEHESGSTIISFRGARLLVLESLNEVIRKAALNVH